MSPRPINTNPLEDTDVLLPSVQPVRHYRRTTKGKVQPLRLTREGEKAILHNACWAFGYLAMLVLAVWLVNGGSAAVTDTDIYGPDELAHAQAERYGYELTR